MFVCLIFSLPFPYLVWILPAHHTVHTLHTVDFALSHGRTLSYVQASELTIAPEEHAH